MADNLAVIVATKGRAHVLPVLLERLARQTVAPSVVYLSACEGSDLCDPAPFDLPVRTLFGPPGSCGQRNRAMIADAGKADVFAFFDDDYMPANTWLEQALTIFGHAPEIVGVTGRVLADGAGGAGIETADADVLVADWEALPPVDPVASLADVPFLYGCNMAVRAPLASELKFDENLPLYGWMEDRDLTARARAHGRCVASDGLAGVHLGAKSGKSSGTRLGMSQVLNACYLRRKGTLSSAELIGQVGRNVLANVAGSLRGDGPVDRRGRLRGNAVALGLLLRGRGNPQAILRY
jgi:GT2 family glycosyltransferase